MTKIQLFFQALLPLCALSYLPKVAEDNIIPALGKGRTPAVLSWPGRNLTCATSALTGAKSFHFISCSVQTAEFRLNAAASLEGSTMLVFWEAFFQLISMYVGEGTFVSTFCVFQLVSLL